MHLVYHQKFCIHSVRKFQPGKQAHLFRFSFFFLEYSSGLKWRNVFRLPPNRKLRKFWLNRKRPLFSVSLGAILTPKRNWRQCLGKTLGRQTKSIMVCYSIFWSGQFCRRLFHCPYVIGVYALLAKLEVKSPSGSSVFFTPFYFFI